MTVTSPKMTSFYDYIDAYTNPIQSDAALYLSKFHLPCTSSNANSISFLDDRSGILTVSTFLIK